MLQRGLVVSRGNVFSNVRSPRVWTLQSAAIKGPSNGTGKRLLLKGSKSFSILGTCLDSGGLFCWPSSHGPNKKSGQSFGLCSASGVDVGREVYNLGLGQDVSNPIPQLDGTWLGFQPVRSHGWSLHPSKMVVWRWVGVTCCAAVGLWPLAVGRRGVLIDGEI